MYLRDTWGQTYGLARAPRFDLRRFFLYAMFVFGALDVLLLLVFVTAPAFAPRPARTAVKRATRTPTAVAIARATATSESQPTLEPTNAPAATRVRRTRTPTPKPTRAPTQAPAPTQTIAPTVVKNMLPARTLAYELPSTLGVGALEINVPPEPVECTPADQMPDVVSESVKLCAGQEYRAFTVRGENIGVFGDMRAPIRASGRGYAIVVEGARIFIRNVMIRATTDANDAAILLCLYPECKAKPGGVAYGGGILVRASDTTIMDSDIAGGVSGVAAERVRGLKLLSNRLDNATGWGSYNYLVESSVFAGNSLSNANRSCTTPGGEYLPTGCESAGWLCIACQQNIIARNTCTNSGDCYYMNGEGKLNSNNNRFHQNECRASPHNCFEVTFASGNEFVENSARADPDTGTACKYPFWIGGSRVIFSRNTWSCTIGADKALADATESTQEPTQIENR